MSQQKRSFFEKLTGIKRIDDGENNITEDEFVINSSGTTVNRDNNESFAPASFEINDDTYEVPSNRNISEEKPVYQEPALQEEQFEETSRNENQPIADKGSMSNIETNEDSDDSEGQLTIDVYQTDEDIIIKSTIAGVKPEDLDVSINNDMVTIKGERKQDEEISADNYYYQECYWGLFSRSVILPVEIIADKAEATMKNGILTLKLPKADTTKTRKIQVRGF